MEVSKCTLPVLLLVLSVLLYPSAIVNGMPVSQEHLADVVEICQIDTEIAGLLCQLLISQSNQEKHHMPQFPEAQSVSKRNAFDAFVSVLQSMGLSVTNAREQFQQMQEDGLINSQGQMIALPSTIRQRMLENNRSTIS
ncbi:uncharacterized protein LOC117117683 [Anneissia japonica]|uniref:uncharacterized protein LOC117117683 n=1 Tax=Anneissia japonica TaxID=1529436 RepID=UPI0014255C35|nr:uncharacterized protein LOC117117683 [Anneissia japonica]